MSKWLDKSKFNAFAKQKVEEAEKKESDKNKNFANKWRNPVMGTVDKAKEYQARLLPDKGETGNGYYEEYHYHGFYKDEQTFQFILCPKTFGEDKFCPWCYVNRLLYKGTEDDKKRGYKYKRSSKFVGNVYIVRDPRDVDQKKDEYKAEGKVKLYEFPATVESKIKDEMTDEENGWGDAIFNPEAGHDLLLKIKAKPKDKNGKEWPDYGDTKFAKKPTGIAEGTDLDELMAERYDLIEYLKSNQLPWTEHKKLLMQEMVWDDVEIAFEKEVNGATVETDMSALDKPEPKPEPDKQEMEKALEKELAGETTPETETSTVTGEDDEAEALLDALGKL
jgi:hypothetical protein